jgi:hypothetical protein
MPHANAIYYKILGRYILITHNHPYFAFGTSLGISINQSNPSIIIHPTTTKNDGWLFRWENGTEQQQAWLHCIYS